MDRKLHELRQVKDHFARFVPEAVRRLVAENPDAPALDKRERDVSVLFVDISGYAQLSERVAPAELNALVEQYFSRFMDEIQTRGGDIDETAGDGVMAIFENADPDIHAAKAVDTALALQAATAALNRDRRGPARRHPHRDQLGYRAGGLHALRGSSGHAVDLHRQRRGHEPGRASGRRGPGRRGHRRARDRAAAG